MSMHTDWNAASFAAKVFSRSWAKGEPGGVIIGFDPGGVKFAYAGGLESLSTGIPFTASSVVRYASVTKHAFCAMVLKHRDLIRLDDRLGDHLPELQSPLADVTVGRALDMTGGLPDTRECLTLLGLSVYTETEASQLLEYLASLSRLNFEAGSEISYSNTGYRLVEAALERKGLRFNDFVKSDIAGLLDIFMEAPDVWNDPVAGLVPGYWKSGDKWQLSSAGLHISASGSLTGSGMALTKWAQALVNGEGVFEGILDKLSAARFLSDGRPTGYGLGLRWNEVGGKRFVGHGGSHPGYKSYFLLDPIARTGMIVVSNREDANTYKMARDCMVALNGLPLPETNCAIPNGLYVTDTGPFWLEMRDGIANWLDSEDTLYDIGDGWSSSMSPSSPVKLRWTGAELEGEIGYVERRLKPVTPKPAGREFDGRWQAPHGGAVFDITDGHVIMGVGPTRRAMPMEDLGHGRALFTLHDGPWTKRVCLHRLNDNRVELVLSRSRMIEYVR
ncbi:CubicO group peptidase (beta-lactamase class C family) [Ochrobactrum daejeonense]|uniref:CubicO group peptidase (Beta-lactamase class C family) n=1 Tax=Brucella daejeonensis TaxID=659015 RepID=A0A7W9EMW4_9HYPH|nr:serine hydrolase domain-containing protein [Brucella daejeonensis]MBB5703842.1 CubicO group peptidase (beta-lactamase class C family) [Brucella daejeonensis]